MMPPAEHTIQSQQHILPIQAGYGGQRILFVPFEFLSWQKGGLWQYGIHYGWEEGLRLPYGAVQSNTIVTIPGIYEIPSSYHASWLYHIEHLLRSQTDIQQVSGQWFDQAFVMLRHHQIKDNTLTWLQNNAPIRVAIIPESLHGTSSKADLWEARRETEDILPYFTHLCCMDEGDAVYYREQGYNTMFCPWAIPERFVQNAQVVQHEHQYQSAGFAGVAYERRAEYVAHPALQNLIEIMPRVEQAFGSEVQFHVLYEEAQAVLHGALHNEHQPTWQNLVEHVQVLRRIRENVFKAYLHTLAQWNTTIILPANFRGYSNRIVEAASAGIPVVSWRPHGSFPRPLTDLLFIDGADIFLFDDGDVTVVAPRLAEQLHTLQTQESLRRRLAQNLIRTVQTHHTTQRRVADIQAWIATGILPWYSRFSV